MEDVLNSHSGMSNEYDTISINSCQNNNVVSIEVCLFIFVIFFSKKHWNKIVLFLFFCFWPQDKTQEDKDEQLNFILLGCLIPFQKEINSLFFTEKQKFLRNKRFSSVFSKTSLNPVFKNRNNLKKLISKTKIN